MDTDIHASFLFSHTITQHKWAVGMCVHAHSHLGVTGAAGAGGGGLGDAMLGTSQSFIMQ